jgi:4-hydroxythreonine-4-phosphate dehydrogenase
MKVAITMGDPAGIGPEIILKCAPVITGIDSCKIYGNTDIFKKAGHDMKLRRNYDTIKKYIINCTRSTAFRYGKPTPTTGAIALASIDSALMSNSDIIITPPIVKKVIQKRTSGFIGHTEYLANYYRTRDFAMVGIWETKRIMLLTTHMPLRKVFPHIKAELIRKKICLFAQGLNQYFKIKDPRIAVSAFNPHGSEFSTGEDEIIKNAVTQAKRKNIDVHGPFPADTLFNRRFDGFLTMYHDQAMIYLKSKRNGLNFTLGLPVIRLSPLYGAALDIAGKGIAEKSGLETALKRSILLYKNVRRYEKTKII